MSNRRKTRKHTTAANYWGHLTHRIDHTRDEATPQVSHILEQAHQIATTAGNRVAIDNATSQEAGITCCPHLDQEIPIPDWYAHVQTPLHWTCYQCTTRTTPTCDACGKTQTCNDAVMGRYSSNCNQHTQPDTQSLTMIALVCNTCYGKSNRP